MFPINIYRCVFHIHILQQSSNIFFKFIPFCSYYSHINSAKYKKKQQNFSVLVLQLLSWHGVECAFPHERDVCEE